MRRSEIGPYPAFCNLDDNHGAAHHPRVTRGPMKASHAHGPQPAGSGMTARGRAVLMTAPFPIPRAFWAGQKTDLGSSRQPAYLLHQPRHYRPTWERHADALSQGPHADALSQGPHADALSQGPHADALSQGPHADALSQGPHADALSQGPHADALSQGPHADALSQGPHADALPQGPHADALSQGPHADALSQGPHADALSQGPHADALPGSVARRKDTRGSLWRKAS